MVVDVDVDVIGAQAFKVIVAAVGAERVENRPIVSLGIMVAMTMNREIRNPPLPRAVCLRDGIINYYHRRRKNQRKTKSRGGYSPMFLTQNGTNSNRVL
mmetsp:Transcript_29317/g.31516  ORF Transcript_29317/g.31516 Transcript_29317/m.31516 type:complete len:99 (-) Transcript_29317:18-314(-)